MGFYHKNFIHKLGKAHCFSFYNNNSNNAHSLWVSGWLIGLLVVMVGFFPFLGYK